MYVVSTEHTVKYTIPITSTLSRCPGSHHISLGRLRLVLPASAHRKDGAAAAWRPIHSKRPSQPALDQAKCLICRAGVGGELYECVFLKPRVPHVLDSPHMCAAFKESHLGPYETTAKRHTIRTPKTISTLQDLERAYLASFETSETTHHPLQANIRFRLLPSNRAARAPVLPRATHDIDPKKKLCIFDPLGIGPPRQS